MVIWIYLIAAYIRLSIFIKISKIRGNNG